MVQICSAGRKSSSSHSPGQNFFSTEELRNNLEQAGLEIVCNWQPGPKKSLFVVAR